MGKHMEEIEGLNAATAAASAASAADLARAQANFDSKIVMLTNTVAANAKHAEDSMTKLTGIVHNIADAAEKDRDNIRKETKAMEDDLNKALARAISIGEAKAKAVEQRIAEHLKGTKRFLQVELNGQVERAADNVEDYGAKGKGRALSSIGDLLATVGAQGAVHAPAEEGVGMGGAELPQIFSGKNIKVSNAVGAINGLVNEYTEACGQVRNRWPMGLGKYLLDRLEISMTGKGVLQVDKVEGKSGNFVYINGRSVGLSNKMSDFSVLASRMSTYESVLAKMTAKIEVPKKPATIYAGPPEWEGN